MARRSCSGVPALALMALMYQPILRFYRLSPLWGLAQPLVGMFYTFCVVWSGWQHWRGQGGMWKGRAQASGGGEMSESGLRQGPQRRKLPRRLLAAQARTPRADHGLLPLRPRGGRHRRSSDRTEADKLARLADMRAGLTGQGAPEAMALAEAARATGPRSRPRAGPARCLRPGRHPSAAMPTGKR